MRQGTFKLGDLVLLIIEAWLYICCLKKKSAHHFNLFSPDSSPTMASQWSSRGSGTGSQPGSYAGSWDRRARHNGYTRPQSGKEVILGLYSLFFYSHPWTYAWWMLHFPKICQHLLENLQVPNILSAISKHPTQCSRLSWKSCWSWAKFWEIQTSICRNVLLVLTKTCQSWTDGLALVSNTILPYP